MGGKPVTPVIKARPLALVAQKKVFLEGYTDSPEFTHIDNPVVYMEEEVLPEERENERDRPRRHPLSQVMNAGDVARSLRTGPVRSPVDQRGRAVAEPIMISDDEDEGGLDDDTFDFLLR